MLEIGVLMSKTLLTILVDRMRLPFQSKRLAPPLNPLRVEPLLRKGPHETKTEEAEGTTRELGIKIFPVVVFKWKVPYEVNFMLLPLAERSISFDGEILEKRSELGAMVL
ncbi:hypothetical protein O181_046712 [Austropuccinia psidii MF-1]|uniref:Uncharacterized protein n=1 Tax=Austropuccinia psidii MF-1 TaxID=1389203 RepID=A0A9Q3HJY5_9BASI|nr:hypothetical protein [Austropuccinia psidii MF-1]